MSTRRMMMMRLFHTITILVTPMIIQNFEAQAQEPRNITRAENETDVFIPCPFGFRPSPSIWKINGTEYFGATLPPIFTQIPGGLFINTVHRCLNHTSFQCVDTSGDSLLGQESDIGFLTVTSQRACTGPGENDDFFRALTDFSPGIIALDHQRIVFGNSNTTLAWISIADDSSCTMSRILSYLPCQSRNTPALNVVINEMEVTVQSENLQISGHLTDFNISSLSDQPSAGGECPVFPVTIRVNATQTEQLNLLVGNNNCTCVDIERHRSLYVAISKPNTNPPDVLCPIYILQDIGSCYNPSGCNRFSGTPFFHICESQNQPASYNMCFGNITEKLNGTRLDFYILNKTMCDSGAPYPARIYMLSFEISAKNATANVSIDTTAGEICFYSSPQECSLTQLTEYNVSIADLTRNLIFMDEVIPESSCVDIQTILHPQCYPLSMSVQPINRFIAYNSVHQLIQDDAGGTILGDVCSCINKTIQELRFTVIQEALITIEYFCSTDYLTPLNITIIVSAGNKTLRQHTIVCSAGRFSVNSSLSYCGQTIDVNGYWTFTNVNETNSTTCSLSNCSVSLSCPTVSPIPNPGIIAGVVIILLLIVILVITAAIICAVIGYKQLRKSLTNRPLWRIQNTINEEQSLHRENLQDRDNNTRDSSNPRDGDAKDENNGKDTCSEINSVL